MKDELLKHLWKAVGMLDIGLASVALEYPENPDHGDFSTNVALANAKILKTNPRVLAEKVVEAFKKDMPDFVESVEIAGAGFINFKLKDKVFADQIVSIASGDGEYGWSKADVGKKIMVEYTDPNPFKIFHIGHLMSNAIGESISRMIEGSGAKVIRACYQGDVGLHVAKTIWALKHEDGALNKMEGLKTATEKVKWLGEMYVIGTAHDEDASIQNEIIEINKKIFDRSDKEINSIYDNGRKWSLEYFDLIYKRLGTNFDKLFFESEVDEEGMKIVSAFLAKGVFAKSEGAVVFKGEDRGLHTRVFVTSQGLPTYETKELGLNTEKFKLYPDLSQSIIVTANEQNDYFKVLLKAFEEIDPDIAKKTLHMSHGIMRFASGKMSSRKGNIVSAESLIDEIKDMVKEKMSGRELSSAQVDEISDQVAIAAIKYTILRQAIGGDVIFDSAKSISFEGDSGPYLQYSAVRAAAVIEKAGKEGVKVAKNSAKATLPEKAGLLEKLIVRFPDIVARARVEYAPQHIAGYLINLAGAFNSFYGNQTIADAKDPLSPYYVALTKSFRTTMTNGLWLLGIKVPEKM
jgi:arginyl-tRNA synthetase